MKAFTYKLKPSARIAAIFGQWLRLCRELYNSALHERREAYRLQRISLDEQDIADRRLNPWKDFSSND